MIAPYPDYRPKHPPATAPESAGGRSFLLERVQPALSGLMDGSLSTLAPIFAVALATHRPLTAFFTGAATALGAGVSMAFSEGLSDTGDLTGRGRPVLRGAITGGGTFDWWYFEAVLDDGSTLVINFMVKDIRGGRGISQPARPVVSFELDRPDGTHVERALHAQDDFAFAADRCDVRVGACTFAWDLHTYRIHLELDAVTADVT